MRAWQGVSPSGRGATATHTRVNTDWLSDASCDDMWNTLWESGAFSYEAGWRLSAVFIAEVCKHPVQFTADEVQVFLQTLQLNDIAAAFKAQNMDGTTLDQVTADQMLGFGLPFGTVNQFLTARELFLAPALPRDPGNLGGATRVAYPPLYTACTASTPLSSCSGRSLRCS